MTRVKPPKSLTSAGRRLWREIAEESELDSAAVLLLNTLCEQFDRMNEARAILKRDGITAKDRFGQIKAHPAVSIEVNAIAAMTRCWRLLGYDQLPSNDIGRPVG